jgi:hypothetical protein
MSDHKDDAFDELKKGFGHLLRAAKSVAAELPTKQIEEVVVGSATEVGRALVSVKDAIEKEVRAVTHSSSPAGPYPGAQAAAPPQASTPVTAGAASNANAAASAATVATSESNSGNDHGAGI